jgi:hypothetical protein
MKLYIYSLFSFMSFLRGLYLDDDKIIICSLLVLVTCVIFLLEKQKGK